MTKPSASSGPNRVAEVSPSLLGRWMQIQLEQGSKAIYETPLSLRITVQSTPPSSLDPCSTEAHDYDDPIPAFIDPATITVEGVEHVAGIDIGYDTDTDTAIVAMAILDYPDLQVEHTFHEQIHPSQPYVPSFLSMRELEHVLAIYDKALQSIPASSAPEVVFVDGFGRWHERQAGLATAFGVARGVPTIGVGKDYQPLRPDLADFVGHNPTPALMPPWPESTHFRSKQKTFRNVCRERLDTWGQFLGVPLYRGGPLVGAAVYSAPGRAARDTSPSPIYISPGNLISLQDAIALTLTCCARKGVRQPEPIIVADRLGRDELARRRDACA